MDHDPIALEIEQDKQDRKGRRITSASRRAELVKGYRESGLTMEQFARSEGIKRNTLAKWVYLHDQRTKPTAREVHGADSGFARVNILPGSAPSPTWAFEVALPNGWVVRAADASGVAQLLGLVRR